MPETFKESLETLFKEARAARARLERVVELEAKVAELEGKLARREWPGPLVSIRELEESQVEAERLRVLLTSAERREVELRRALGEVEGLAKRARHAD